MTAQINSEILQSFKDGNQKAFNKVFSVYIRPITYFCQSLTGNEDDAQDIAVNTFYKLFTLHEKFATESNIKAFLYITARNACFDHLKAAKRQAQRMEEFTHFFESMAKLENRIIEIDVLDDIYREIKKLPARCKETFSLLYLEHLTPKEVAERLNITVENVYNHKKRAVELLRLALLNISPVAVTFIYLNHLLSGK
jgi:RNA polymerase sigma-70 factor (ECF subfamily)